jgi:hypothetical protein
MVCDLCKGAWAALQDVNLLAILFFKATDPLQGQSENGALARDKISNLREEAI